MALPTEHPKDIFTVRASGDVTAKRFVGHDGAQLANSTTGALGVSYYDADDGKEMAVVTAGTVLMTAKDVVSVGDEITCDTQGAAIPAETGTWIHGVARSAATAADEEIEVLIRPALAVKAAS